jgi:hypothetical protein
MVPSAFVFLPRLPLAPNGKVDRAALPLPPEPVTPGSASSPLRTDLERLIAEIWRQVLPTASFGAHDNFFDRGGHSLLLAQVATALGARLGREIPVLTLFENPTVATLARALGDTGATAATAGRAAEEEAARIVAQRRSSVVMRRRASTESAK